MEQPTDRDILNAAAIVDDLAASAAIERAFHDRPPTPLEEINAATIARICRSSDPVKARAALLLDDLYATGAFGSEEGI